MSVLVKLNQARAKFHSKELKKSGHNKFAGYYYFELGDFIVPALQIFDEVGLCGLVSFPEGKGTLTITDLEDGSQVVIESPMAEAQLKGCHPIQNLGAAETYLRRYLWVAALEIVEHDAVDSSAPIKKESSKSVAQAQWEETDPENQAFLREVADKVKQLISEGDVPGAVFHLEAQKFDSDDKTAIWYLFDSKQRAAIKKFQEETK